MKRAEIEARMRDEAICIDKDVNGIELAHLQDAVSVTEALLREQRHACDEIMEVAEQRFWAALKEQRERWGHRIQCACHANGNIECEHDHPYRDPRCAPQEPTHDEETKP